MEQASTSTPASTPAAPKAGETLDIAKLTAEIAALADLAGAAASGGTSGSDGMPVERGIASTPPAAASGIAGTDFAALEREIEALLAGGAAPATTPEPGRGTDASTEMRELQAALDDHLDGRPTTDVRSDARNDVRNDALVAKPIDPLMREVETLLADDADALLANAEGDIGRAVQSVFDPRALSSQEEDVNRAMIDAFGSSRTNAFSFGDAVVTNPAPRFDGVSKELPPELPRTDHDRAAREKPSAAPTRSFESIAMESLARKETEYAGEKPFEPAFPALPVEATDHRTTVVPSAAAVVATEPDASNLPAVSPAVRSAPAPSAVATPEPARDTAQPEAVVARQVATVSPATAGMFDRLRGALLAVVSLPLVVCALPMRFVPAAARGVVGIAAITTVLWVPVAWWYATGLAKKPGVGPVALVERPQAGGEDGGAAKPATTTDPESTEDARGAHANAAESH